MQQQRKFGKLAGEKKRKEKKKKSKYQKKCTFSLFFYNQSYAQTRDATIKLLPKLPQLRIRPWALVIDLFIHRAHTARIAGGSRPNLSTISERENPPITECYTVQKPRSTDFEA